MRFKYGKYTPIPLDDLDMDELMSKLSDLLLSSGFHDPYFSGSEDERSMQALYDAILEALLSGGVLPDETLKQLLGDQADDEAQRAARAVDPADHGADAGERLHHARAGHRRRVRRAARGAWRHGRAGETRPTRFEVTDKALDFLGYRALRDLLGSLGKSSFGRHDTRDLATGIEASGATKPYEFGDTLNLDASATVLNLVRRARPRHARGRHARPRVRGPGRRAGRVSELVRDGDHARLQPQHDPVRRGPLHAGQARRPGALAADSPAVSRRQPAPGAVPRLGRGSARSASSDG